LQNSKHSSQALELIAREEVTKQKNAEVERAKYQALQQELAIKRIREEEAAGARTLEMQSQHERARADYKDHLERKRITEQLNAQRQLQDEDRRKNEDSLRRQEEIRRRTLEYEAELRQSTEIARTKAEAEGRILQERQNHDLVVDKKKIEMKEYRETVLEGIKLASSTIGSGVRDFLGDKEKLGNLALTVTTVSFGIYLAKTSTGVAGRYVESRLGKPSLVRETSKVNYLLSPRAAVTGAFGAVKQIFYSTSADAALKDVVLVDTLEKRLKRIAVSTSNTKANRAPYRHLLLHG
jgi:ATPase family AAA domain-containing protein 3A/B